MIGQFVTSVSGHDKGTLYVVVAATNEYVMLCDGRLKPTTHPKKKRFKHVQLINKKVDVELIDALQKGLATNEQIKYAIKHYN